MPQNNNIISNYADSTVHTNDTPVYVNWKPLEAAAEK